MRNLQLNRWNKKPFSGQMYSRMIVKIKPAWLLIWHVTAFLFLVVSCISETSPRKQRVCIQQISGFPDGEPGYASGVSACYAGNIGNQLIMAGGCNFADIPAAEGGAKCFYKGIYSAQITADSVFIWRKIGELPFPAAYGVSISFPDKMIIVGGTNAGGGITSVFSLRLTGLGEAVLDTLSSLPFTLDNMAGATLGNTIYVIGGNCDGKPSTSVFSLNLDEPENGWQVEPALPGFPRVQPVCAVQDSMLYVWGGFCPSFHEHEANVATDGYRYLPEQKVWDPVSAPVIPETKETLTLTGGSSVALSDSFVLCVGGVDKEIFLDAISGDYTRIAQKEYLKQPVSWYRFNGRLMVYNTRRNCWNEWKHSSGLARAGAALVRTGRTLFVIGGEIKPGIRTPEIYKLIIE